MNSMMQDLAFAIPGIDEAMGFAEVMKFVLRSFLPPLPCSPFSHAQARQVDAVLRHRLRHCSHWSHPPFLVVPLGAREGSREAERSFWAVRTDA
jgi:hypothetical protein